MNQILHVPENRLLATFSSPNFVKDKKESLFINGLLNNRCRGYSNNDHTTTVLMWLMNCFCTSCCILVLGIVWIIGFSTQTTSMPLEIGILYTSVGGGFFLFIFLGMCGCVDCYIDEDDGWQCFPCCY